MPDPDLKPLDRRAPEARRERIVKAASSLFAEQGYEDTSMAQVARRAGVAVGTVYLSFPDKPSLRIGVVNHQKALIAQLIAARSPTDGTDLRGALRDIIGPVLSQMLTAGAIIGPVDRAKLESLGPEAIAAYNAVDDAIRGWMALLTERGLARPLDSKTAPLLASGLMMSGAEACRRGLSTPAAMTEELIDMLTRLFAPDPPP